ncbi:MAG: F0F1 ATP synthase subunit A [Candidatus Atribacteria bacterium]|nr:F0F1 ATP synthase subunit A [Candidatus Atribacteria bacterium]
MEFLTTKIYFYLGTLPVTKTVVSTWLVMGALIIASILATRHLKFIPGRWQNILEMFVEGIINMIEDMSPHNGKQLLPLVGALALFIGSANLAGLIPGLKAPTSDFNTTLALALVVFCAVPYYGVKNQGWKNYLKVYITPSPIMAPFHIISEVTRTFSLALRLFGNILGEEIVIAILFILSPLIVPVPMMLFAIFTGVIQAYIFTILTIVYLSAAIEKEDSAEG